VLLPAGIWLVLRLVPQQVLADSRTRAQAALERPASRAAAVVIMLVWIASAVALGAWLLPRFS